MADYKLFTEVGDSLIVNVDYLRIWLPKAYFENGIANFMGNYIETLGVFYTSIHGSAELDGSLNNLQLIKLPMVIKFMFNDAVDIEYEIGGVVDKYKSVLLKKGAVFMADINLPMSVDNVDKFLNMLNVGRLPHIEYHKLMQLFYNVLEVNNFNLKTSSFVLEAWVAELQRDKNNIIEPFRRIHDRKGVTELDYKPVNIKNLAHINGSFSSLAFEDFNKGVTISVERSKTGKPDRESPLEKILQY